LWASKDAECLLSIIDNIKAKCFAGIYITDKWLKDLDCIGEEAVTSVRTIAIANRTADLVSVAVAR